MPAPEAASATVEDVGGALVGVLVARCWITWFFEEVCFTNIDWLPLATPMSQNEICQDDIIMTKQSGAFTKQRCTLS